MNDLDRLIEAVECGNIAGRTPHCDLPAMLVLGAYAGSLDAAQALHDALLPGWTWSVYWGEFDDWQASVHRHDDIFDLHISEFSCSSARAWLIAILKAHRSQVQK